MPDSFAHPAKMDAQLLIWIVERYTKEGETILDPMAGSGTTMLACTLGRNCILVELEEKFCKMMRDNWELVRMRPQLGSQMGDCQIIQGDARQLEGLVDKIVTSPPYAESLEKPLKEGQTRGIRGHKRPKSNTDTFWQGGYSENPNNIANLPYGEIDKCIFSPPYAEAISGGGIAKYGHFSDPKLAQRAYSAENMNIKKQIKRVEEGKAKMKRPDVFTSEGNKAAKGFFEGTYSRDPDNIGNLPYGQIDKIVTSPPYSDVPTISESYLKIRSAIGRDTTKPSQGYRKYSSVDSNNIGNLKSESYLEAMLQVYQQCYLVLKPQGLMILVTKNFIRNKQIVRLDVDTILLCGQAGFKFVERHYRKLPSQSFWRVIYHQKHPEVEQILNEDVLVFKK